MSNLQPVCLITGASAGIGAALARVFAGHGHALALVARRQAPMAALADEITAAGGKRPHVFAIDLEAREGCSRLAEALLARGLEPAVVVNNAGFGLNGDAAVLAIAEQARMIDLNARALTDLSLRWVDSLERRSGGILNVASIASFMPRPGMAVYHATKAYVLSLSLALHSELRPRGVRVTALCPGPVLTEFQHRAGIPADAYPSFLTRSAGRVARNGYEALARGEAVAVPGTPNRILAVLPRFLPRGLAAYLGSL